MTTIVRSGPDRAPTREPSRHDRVWLAPAMWRDALRGDLDESRMAEVDDWVRRGRALVTRRRDVDAGAGTICLGIALPCALDRRRIGLIVDRRAVIRHARPLALEEIVDAAPWRHRAALRDLCARATALDTSLAVYGSFAWQAICGEACVASTSDLDLLWDARDGVHIDRMIGLLTAWESDSGLRADGEARFADGDAVAWRELATGASRVLAKRDDGVAWRARPGRLVARQC